MPRRPPLLTRRRVLGGSAALLLVAGCDDDATPEPARSDSPAATSASGSASGPARDATADEALVAEVVAQLSTAHALVRRTRRAEPVLADDLLRFEVLHRRHARALGGVTEAGSPRVGAGPTAAAKRVRTTESRLLEHLESACLAAESGALAALLASMCAGLTQELDPRSTA